MDADEIDPFLDEIIKQKVKENGRDEQEMVDLLTSDTELSRGAKRVLMYLKNLEGEAEISDLETVMKAAPIMDESKLDDILESLEEVGKVKRKDSMIELA